MSYPKDGGRKQGAQAGRYVLDFENGIVTAPNGDTEEMSNDLKKIGSNFARSIFIAVSTVDAKIKIGQNILPQSHQLTYVVQGIGFQGIVIEFPIDRIPVNDFSFMVIASDAEIFPIDLGTLIASHSPAVLTDTTTDAFVILEDFSFVGYNQVEMIIENTLGVNALTADVQVSEDGINFVSAQNYPLDIATNDANVFQSSVSHKFIRVRVKSKTPALPTDYRVQTHLER